MEIEVRELDEQPVASIVVTTTKDGIGAELGIVLPEVGAYLRQIGAEPTGPAFARWWRYEEDGVEMEGGLPVATQIVAGGRVSPATLPGGPAAVGLHVGPYTALHGAYDEIEAWARADGRELGEGPWEVYLTDPGEVPDSADWRTEVVWPLA